MTELTPGLLYGIQDSDRSARVWIRISHGPKRPSNMQVWADTPSVVLAARGDVQTWIKRDILARDSKILWQR
jgi:hypothetical protein